MKVLSSGQVTEADFLGSGFHVLICASGFEARASNVASKIKLCDGAILRVWSFKDRKVLHRPENDKFFEDLQFKKNPEMDGGDFGSAFQVFQDAIVDAKERFGSKLRLAVDYSCMTRAWYGAIVRALFSWEQMCDELEVYFCYSPAQFTPPAKVVVNTLAGPLTGFTNLWTVDRPVALILGLGYEGVRAAGLREYLDPARTVAFYTDPALDQRFTTTVEKNNETLLRTLEPRHILRHPLTDMDRTAALLHDVTSELAKQFRVIVAPLGIKPFSLLSMLLAARYADFDVWRVSGGGSGTPTEREAVGLILPYKIKFTDGIGV